MADPTEGELLATPSTASTTWRPRCWEMTNGSEALAHAIETLMEGFGALAVVRQRDDEEAQRPRGAGQRDTERAKLTSGGAAASPAQPSALRRRALKAKRGQRAVRTTLT
jgi:hypothetical protein